MPPDNIPKTPDGPSGMVPQGTPQQNPNVTQPQVDRSVLPGQGMAPPATHLEALPVSRRKRSMIALISLVAIVAVAAVLFVALF